MPYLLDLPSDLLPLILGQTQWSARRTCRALLDHQSAGRTSLKLWGKDDPRSNKQLAGLLAQLPHLAALHCFDTTQKVRNIRPIAVVGHHLQSLELNSFDDLQDISPISVCSQLSSLKIRRTDSVQAQKGVFYAICFRFDLRPLSSCELLTEVDLSGVQPRCPRSLSDLSPLAVCVRIKSLHFRDYTGIIEASPLSSLVELTSLRLGGSLQNIGALAACTRLADLRLITVNGNPPLAPLALCQQLTSLYICSECNGADLLPLAKCARLTQLTLTCLRLTDVSALQNFPWLHSLTLRWCGNLIDISPLSHCKMLGSLVVSGCVAVSEESISTLKAVRPGLSVRRCPL